MERKSTQRVLNMLNQWLQSYESHSLAFHSCSLFFFSSWSAISSSVTKRLIRPLWPPFGFPGMEKKTNNRKRKRAYLSAFLYRRGFHTHRRGKTILNSYFIIQSCCKSILPVSRTMISKSSSSWRTK